MSETQHTPGPWERKDRYPLDGYKREVFGGGNISPLSIPPSVYGRQTRPTRT